MMRFTFFHGALLSHGGVGEGQECTKVMRFICPAELFFTAPRQRCSWRSSQGSRALNEHFDGLLGDPRGETGRLTPAGQVVPRGLLDFDPPVFLRLSWTPGTSAVLERFRPPDRKRPGRTLDFLESSSDRKTSCSDAVNKIDEGNTRHKAIPPSR